ncbi:MAG: hypothetical protein LKE28_09655 [Sphaerochaeta sp.]|jgi:hypothetical protein|nr:hypothetical protein [Sphaerochaeta sp.]
MAVRYWDIVDIPMRSDEVGVSLEAVLVPSADGKSVVERPPTEREISMFIRNRLDSSLISRKVAEALSLNPGLSYDVPLEE